jgi:hypothetical protein
MAAHTILAICLFTECTPCWLFFTRTPGVPTDRRRNDSWPGLNPGTGGMIATAGDWLKARFRQKEWGKPAISWGEK